MFLPAQKTIDGGQQTANRRPKTSCELADAEHAVARHHHPVKQRRLLKPRHATKRRRDEIAALEHLAGDLRIARLIRSDERKRTQPIKSK